MNDADSILDYASPRKRSVLRLPAVSRLSVDVGDGRVHVQESLVGKAQEAVAALTFGIVVLAVASSATAMQAFASLSPLRPRNTWPMAFWTGIPALGELACMVAVVQQTWRRTLLTVEYNDLRLAFLSPLRRRRYRWTADAIADVVVVPTANLDSLSPLGEILMTRPVGGEIRLFTDHQAPELHHIAVAIDAMLRDGRAVPIPAATPLPLRRMARPFGVSDRVDLPSGPSVPADVGPQAEATAGRLLDVRRDVRGRLNGTEPPGPPGDGSPV